MAKAAVAKEPLTMEQRELAAEHVKLAQKIAEKRINPYVPPEDRLQDAYNGLIDAAREFDPSRGVKFETYASFRIRGAITDAERDLYPMIRVPYSTTQRTGAASPKVVSVEVMNRGNDWGESSRDLQASSFVFIAPEPRVTSDDRDAIETALSVLSARERIIVEARFEHGSQVAAARAAGVSESRVSQVLPDILRRLRGSSALACYAEGA